MKTVIISDIHGCYDEFTELLDKIKYTPKTTRLIILGDMVDRGPKSDLVVRKIKSMNIEVSIGNHDSKMVRWRKHYKNFIDNKVPNPMKKVSEYDYSQYLKLNQDEIDWTQLCMNKNSKVIEILRNNQDKINWHWFSQNPNIFKLNYEEIRKNFEPIAEEIIAKALHPKRMIRYIEQYNFDFEDWFD